MTARRQLFTASLLAGVTIVAAPMLTAAQPSEESAAIATEQLGGTILTVAPRISYENAVLRVAGPDDYALTMRFEAGQQIIADLLADREVRAAGDEAAEQRLATTTAMLLDGKYVFEVVLTDDGGAERRYWNVFFVSGGSAVSRGAKRSALEGIRSELAAGASADPTPTGGEVGAAGVTENDFLVIEDGAGDGITSIGIDSDNNNVTFEVWQLVNNFGNFYIGECGADVLTDGDDCIPRIAILDDVGGRVGIGTAAPQSDLHLVADDGEIRITGNGQTWAFDAADDSFYMGAVGASLPIILNEPVLITGGAVVEAQLHVFGDARVDGDIAIASSRSLKTAFGSVSSSEILARVADLPIASWRYKSEEEAARHIGPFAEDFQRLFGLGDGETISVIDAQGVALAAIQGLAERNAALEREVAEKAAELEQLRSATDARIAEILAGNAELAKRLAAIEE